MILVKNAKIVDGSGEPMRRGDVLVSGGAVSAIGNFPNKKADTVIEGLGMYLTPGFVATKTHIDRNLSLFTDPKQKALTEQGITTVIGGADGISLAPLGYGSLHALGAWTGKRRINVDWHGVAELNAALGRLPLGVNFGTLAGYTTIRRDITSDGEGDMTDKEMAVAIRVAETAMEEGAFGVSLDLEGEWGTKISHEEARQVTAVVARKGGVLSIRLRRNEGHYMEAVREALALYKSTGATMVVCDFVPHDLNKAGEKDFFLAYDMLRSAGDNLFVELFFADTRHVKIGDLLPHALRHEDPARFRTMLRDKKTKKEILASLPRCPEAKIIHVPPEHRHLQGLTIETLAHSRGVTVKEAIVELMCVTDMHATIAIPHATSSVTRKLMEDDKTLLAGSPAALFAAADEARWPIEKTVMRLTGMPARIFGIEKRGIIRENFPADLVLMDDRYTITRVVVNGVDGTPNGRALRKKI